jgi:hypothetical protein
VHDNEYLAEGLDQLEGANPQVPQPTFPRLRPAARRRGGWRHHGSPYAVQAPFTPKEAISVAQRPMCFTRAGRKHGEPLTRPLPTVVPGDDRDMPGPPPTPVIGTAPDLCLFKPDGDRPRIDCRSWHVEKEPVVIKQAPVKGRNAIKVSFALPQDAIPGKTSVVGTSRAGTSSPTRYGPALTAPAAPQ